MTAHKHFPPSSSGAERLAHNRASADNIEVAAPTQPELWRHRRRQGGRLAGGQDVLMQLLRAQHGWKVEA